MRHRCAMSSETRGPSGVEGAVERQCTMARAAPAPRTCTSPARPPLWMMATLVSTLKQCIPPSAAFSSASAPSFTISTSPRTSCSNPGATYHLLLPPRAPPRASPKPASPPNAEAVNISCTSYTRRSSTCARGCLLAAAWLMPRPDAARTPNPSASGAGSVLTANTCCFPDAEAKIVVRRSTSVTLCTSCRGTGTSNVTSAASAPAAWPFAASLPVWHRATKGSMTLAAIIAGLLSSWDAHTFSNPAADSCPTSEPVYRSCMHPGAAPPPMTTNVISGTIAMDHSAPHASSLAACVPENSSCTSGSTAPASCAARLRAALLTVRAHRQPAADSFAAGLPPFARCTNGSMASAPAMANLRGSPIVLSVHSALTPCSRPCIEPLDMSGTSAPTAARVRPSTEGSAAASA
mmetsp:Transcript_36521/g.91044  ORF Transcript_36521/g.91044 Transcript_36521/m.91044 type:complete len:407 (+) Transcript_36521:3694-4914(+)